MEQVLPGTDADDPDYDPIIQASELHQAGDQQAAHRLLLDLLAVELRCLVGCGLCLWRLGRFDHAAEVFERMLWLNPADNQGARGLLPAVRAGEPWQDEV